MAGVFASSKVNPTIVNGLIYGDFDLFYKQVAGAFLIAFFAIIVTLVITLVLSLFMPLRVSKDEEELGLDIVEHGETAYGSSMSMSLDKRNLYNYLQKKKKQYQSKTLLRNRKK